MDDGPSEITVHGKVAGNVSAGRVIVSATGAVHGNVTALSVEVHGEVIGDVSAERVVLGASGRIAGDVKQNQLSIELGARFDGMCRWIALPAAA
jgi:cytoskeletal protein CcmA (bactofilin family)